MVSSVRENIYDIEAAINNAIKLAFNQLKETEFPEWVYTLIPRDTGKLQQSIIDSMSLQRTSTGYKIILDKFMLPSYAEHVDKVRPFWRKTKTWCKNQMGILLNIHLSRIPEETKRVVVDL